MDKRTKHGEARGRGKGTPEYRAWQAMWARVRNSYKPGIRVCNRWKEYENFLADMGRKPTPKHSLDRINNEGNYEPGNCRWATNTMQLRNMSRNHLVEFNGRTQTLAEWAEEIGMRYATLWSRIGRYGWTTKRALTQPVQSRRISNV
jgi:hypothetical protein